VQQWIANFDANARGRSYDPFLHVRDVPSKGRSSMVKGMKTGRTHHLLSDLEYDYFIKAEYEPWILDIREQYPLLPREETISIAKELGIIHPCYLGSNVPIVMTTDMVLTYGGNNSYQELPVSIKYASDLCPSGNGGDEYNRTIERTIEKLQIEKRYWLRRCPRWALRTEEMRPLNRVRNLDAWRTAVMAEESDWLNPLLSRFVVAFNASWSNRKRLKDLFFEIAIQFRITPADSAVLFGRALWLRLLPVDLDSGVLHHEFPVALAPDLPLAHSVAERLPTFAPVIAPKNHFAVSEASRSQSIPLRWAVC
jgi:hypothetical protein